MSAAPNPAPAAMRADPYAPKGLSLTLESAGAILLALIWVLPLAYAVWAAFHPAEYTTRFVLTAPLTLDNFTRAWAAAPFARYFLNTFILVTLILTFQIVLGTLAAYALARQDFWGRDVAFVLILAQLMIMPDALIVENYRTLAKVNLIDTIPAIALPYIASAFGIFLLRQTFKTVPKELDDAARVEGASPLQVLMKVYVPLAKPTYVAYGLVSVSYHWNNYLWPLIVTRTPANRTLTVGLAIFAKSKEANMQWANVCAATFIIILPLMIAFFFLQKQFMESFIGAGIKE